MVFNVQQKVGKKTPPHKNHLKANRVHERERSFNYGRDDQKTKVFMIRFLSLPFIQLVYMPSLEHHFKTNLKHFYYFFMFFFSVLFHTCTTTTDVLKWQ